VFNEAGVVSLEREGEIDKHTDRQRTLYKDIYIQQKSKVLHSNT